MKKFQNFSLPVEVNVLWATHQVHHSSEHFNLSTALRQSVPQVYLHIVSVNLIWFNSLIWFLDLILWFTWSIQVTESIFSVVLPSTSTVPTSNPVLGTFWTEYIVSVLDPYWDPGSPDVSWIHLQHTLSSSCPSWYDAVTPFIDTLITHSMKYTHLIAPINRTPFFLSYFFSLSCFSLPCLYFQVGIVTVSTKIMQAFSSFGIVCLEHLKQRMIQSFMDSLIPWIHSIQSRCKFTRINTCGEGWRKVEVGKKGFRFCSKDQDGNQGNHVLVLLKTFLMSIKVIQRLNHMILKSVNWTRYTVPFISSSFSFSMFGWRKSHKLCQRENFSYHSLSSSSH